MSVALQNKANSTANKKPGKHQRASFVKEQIVSPIAQSQPLATKPHSGCACGGGCPSCAGLSANIKLSQSGDVFEREADNVAQRVTSGSEPDNNPTHSKSADNAVLVKRSDQKSASFSSLARSQHGEFNTKTAESNELDEEQEELSVKSSPIAGVNQPSHLAKSSGKTLPAEHQSYFENRFGVALGHVQIHDDQDAHLLARNFNAKAFTQGNHIFFASSQFKPDTRAGKRLLAHELVHTQQQSPLANPAIAGQVLTKRSMNPAFVQREVNLPARENPTGDFDLNPSGNNPGRVSADDVLAENTYELSEDVHVDSHNLTGGAPQGFDAGTSEQDAQGASNCPDILTPIVDFARQDSGLIPQGTAFPSLAVSFIPFPFNVVAAGAIEGATALWNGLPLAAKAATVNAMIDVGIDTLSLSLESDFTDKYSKIALRAFLRRLKREPDQRKVDIAERMGNLILGRDVQFFWGFLKGLVVGFFVDGLLGIIQMVIDIICLIPMLFSFIDRVLRFIELFPQAIRDAIQALVDLRESVEEALNHAVETLMEIYHHPERVMEFIEQIDERMTALAEATGQRGAEMMLRAFGQPFDRIGFAVGRVFGMVIFEIVLAIVAAVLTAYIGGAGAAGSATVSAGKTALRTFVAGLRRGVAFIARQIAPITRFVSRFLDKAKDFVLGLRTALTGAWRAVSTKLGRVFDKVKDLFQRFMLLIGDSRFFLQFIAIMRAKMLQPRFSVTGIQRAPLYTIVMSERNKPRFIRVIGLPAIKAADNRGNWIIKVGRAGLPLVKVGIAEARMDGASRKHFAGRFIQERVDDMRDARITDENIEDEIRPYKNAYHLDRLYSRYNSSEDEFDIRASASPEDEIASRESPWPVGTQQDPVPIRWFRLPGVFPTIKVYRNGENGQRELVSSGSPLTGVNLPAFRSMPAQRLQVLPTNMRPIVAMQKGARGNEHNKEQVASRLKNDPNIEVVEPDGTVLSGFRATPPYYAIDHIRELTLDGDDNYANLWPVRSTINSAFNANFNQAIWLQYGENIDKNRVKYINAKWVKVDDTADEVPRTSGGHGTNKSTWPINRGRLTGGVRKKYPRLNR